jgi:predicted transglutaminase-like cysteine proteinase
MMAEIIPEAYDAVGKKVFGAFDRRRGPHPTFPMGRYVSQSLTVKCRNLDEIREFLGGCKRVSDEEQFGREDYWQPPEHFEQTKKGDCDDFPCERGASFMIWATPVESSSGNKDVTAQVTPGCSSQPMAPRLL